MHKYCSSVFNVLEKLSHTLVRTRQIYESLSVLISLSVFVSININRIRVLLVYRNHKKSEAKRALRIATKFALKYPETWFVFCLNFMIFKTLIREQFNLVGADVLAFSPVLKLKQAFFFTLCTLFTHRFTIAFILQDEVSHLEEQIQHKLSCVFRTNMHCIVEK